MKRKVLITLAFLLVACVVLFFTAAPALVERAYNTVHTPPPYNASERARALHRTLFVADLHADTLLWQRDPLARSTRGHVDVPRLVEGGVSLQFFTVVTKAPRGQNYERNEEDAFDNITPLVVAQAWPLKTWTSLRERALHQSRRLGDAAARSNGALVVVRTSEDLARFVERRASGETRAVAALLGLEGAHALEGDLASVDVLYDAGFRMVAPTHFFDNDWGGSAHGARQGGLTDKGRALVRRLEERRVLVDLAHASEATIDDVLAMAARPVVVSHTGLRGVCDNARNLSDEHARRVAATGGLLGIGFWPTATCGRDAQSIARSIRYAADLVGVAHVALGSDFDGTVAVPFDATGLAQVTDALLAEGFNEEEIRLIMGGNVVRLLSDALPTR